MMTMEIAVMTTNCCNVTATLKAPGGSHTHLHNYLGGEASQGPLTEVKSCDCPAIPSVLEG